MDLYIGETSKHMAQQRRPGEIQMLACDKSTRLSKDRGELVFDDG